MRAGGSGGGGQPGRRPSVQNKTRKLEGRHPGAGGSAPKAKQLTFEIFFPPPGSAPLYRGAQYRAARGKDGLYNFVGLVLGHGGATVQRIQRASGAKIEVRDSAGNLNGAHPSSHGDPSLHAWVAAASRQRLEKAVQLLLDVLQPTNTKLHPVAVAPGGCVVLEPVIPSDWPGVAEAAAAIEQEQAAGAAAAAEAAATSPRPPQPTPASNAWNSNRLLKQHMQSPQASPLPSPVSGGRPRDAYAACSSSTSSSAASEADEDDVAAAAGDPCLGLSGGLESPASVVPPPPPPRRRRPSLPAAVPAAAPATAPQATAPPPPPPRLQHAASAGAAFAQPEMATVWAKGLHLPEGPPVKLEKLENPATPSAAAERTTPQAPEYFRTISSDSASSGSWSLWGGQEQGGGSRSSFYEQLQAVASDTFSCAPPAAAAAAPAAAHGSVGTNPMHMLPPGCAPQLQHHLMPPAPHALVGPPPSQLPLPAPFPGLERHHQLGLAGAMASLTPPGMAMPAAPPSTATAMPGLLLPQHGALYPQLSGTSLSFDAEHDLQKLLDAVASMATLE